MKASEDVARGIVERLREAGHVAYYAGGCVRDMLMEIEPKDYDIATSARPEEVKHLFKKTIEVGEAFGVVCVIENGFQYQVATFRSDKAYIDGRHPESVVFSSPEQDAQRRDFTINGLFYDPIERRVIDYVGGRTDIERRLLRAIGDPDARIQEDALRLLRAVRFAAHFSLETDPATWEAVCRHAEKIRRISAERIREEVVRVFLSPQRVRGLDLLDESGLLEIILPEVTAMKGVEQPPQFHPEGDVFVHTRLMLEKLPEEVSVPLVFGVLFHDIGKPGTQSYDEAEDRIRFTGHEKLSAEITESIMKRLRFSRAEIEGAIEIVRNHMAFKDVQNMRPAKIRRLLAKKTFPDELELHRVDCEASHGELGNYHFLIQKREEIASEPVLPEPLITGHDLIQIGYMPGPRFSEILSEVQTRQLEGDLKTKKEAVDFVLGNFSK